MSITPDMIFLLKAFGSVVIFLLTVITALGGVIWRGLRRDLRNMHEDFTKAIQDLKEDEKRRCDLCSSHNKYEHDAMWDAIDKCCPRGK